MVPAVDASDKDVLYLFFYNIFDVCKDIWGEVGGLVTAEEWEKASFLVGFILQLLLPSLLVSMKTVLVLFIKIVVPIILDIQTGIDDDLNAPNNKNNVGFLIYYQPFE